MCIDTKSMCLERATFVILSLCWEAHWRPLQEKEKPALQIMVRERVKPSTLMNNLQTKWEYCTLVGSQYRELPKGKHNKKSQITNAQRMMRTKEKEQQKTWHRLSFFTPSSLQQKVGRPHFFLFLEIQRKMGNGIIGLLHLQMVQPHYAIIQSQYIITESEVVTPIVWAVHT